MLRGKICVVTGASRGVGRGVALALAAQGATVYITGRTRQGDPAILPGTLQDTVDEIARRGGQGIAVPCDHSDDSQVRSLFDKIEGEHGCLDLLVNNASAIPDRLTETGPFWRKPLALSDMFDVGLRSNYVAAYYAAPLLAAKAAGLLVNISSFGARCYMHGPAYGAAKAGNDKMAHDMAHDFRHFGVAAVSLWLGLVKTERTMALCASEPEKYAALLAQAESPEFAGRVIAGLLRNPQRMDVSGQVLIAAELAQEYGICDIDDSRPPSHRPFLGSPAAWNAAVIE